MFAEAVTKVAEYTRPIIISKRLENQEVSCGIATFIVVNDEGWVLTCAHVVQDALLAQQHNKERQQYQDAVTQINANAAWSPGKKKHEIGKLNRNWQWITHHSLWWGVDGLRQDEVHFDVLADLACAQLKGPIDKLEVKQFPVFADPKKPIQQGTSLCRLGFPFHDVKALFDSATGNFSIPDLPALARFPNDSIMTRNVMIEDANSKRNIHFLETSTAGLRGQSGGPIFDVNATVWALQSKTNHLALGFAPKVSHKGKEVTEHQFMHVGWGTHVSHIRDMFQKLNVKFQSA